MKSFRERLRQDGSQNVTVRAAAGYVFIAGSSMFLEAFPETDVLGTYRRAFGLVRREYGRDDLRVIKCLV